MHPSILNLLILANNGTYPGKRDGSTSSRTRSSAGTGCRMGMISR